MSIPPITYLSAPEQQHMLFLALPLKADLGGQAADGSEVVAPLVTLFSGRQSDGTPVFDSRPATGVHFFMAYVQLAGFPVLPPPPFPLFQVPPPNPQTGKPRHLAVVQALYDADFGPYIGAFTSDEGFAAGLDKLLAALDETGFVDPGDPTSAQGILANQGTYANPDAFLQVLMRYNFADPTIPAALHPTLPKNPTKLFLLGATFPGLTDTKILKTSGGFPNASQLWPGSTSPAIVYAPSVPPPKPQRP